MPQCSRCQNSVYQAEQVVGPGRKFYHKSCLKCTSCDRRLDSWTLVEHDEEPYCKQCHLKTFGTRDLRHQNHPHASQPRSMSSGETLPVSSPVPSRVIPLSLNTSNHATPLLRPTRALSPTSQNFPRPPSGPGSGGESGQFNGFSSLNGTNSILEEPEAPVVQPSFTSAARRFSDEIKNTEDDAMETCISPQSTSNSNVSAPSFPTNTGRPGTGNIPRTVPLPLDHASHVAKHRPSQSTTSVETHSTSSSITSNPSSPSRYAPSFGRPAPTTDALNLLEQEGIIAAIPSTPTGSRYGAALSGGGKSPTGLGVQMTGSPRKWGGAPSVQCPVCSDNVYFAEQVKAIGKTFHKRCLRCMECRTGLDSSKLRDHDGQPFCMRCYNKLYGPQGRGYALLGKAGG